MQRSLARLLERRLSAEVTVLESSVEALALVEGGARFDAAVIDLEMPEMDGAELVERLREIEPELPTGLWSGSDRLVDLATSAAFAISKAQPIAEVIAAVGWLIERRRATASAVIPRRRGEPAPGEGTNGH